MNQHLPTVNDDSSDQDADSDLEELQGDIAKFDESVRGFLAAHHGTPLSEMPHPTLSRGAPRGRGARGPRKAAKPRGDITARLSKVNQAFLAGDYSRALDEASEVIRINAETHQAWTALSSIFAETGDNEKALSAMTYAAHLRPKEVAGWLRCASFALDIIEGEEMNHLHTARLCYSAALRADPTHVEARLGKATVCHRQGHLAAAIAEYKQVLKLRPGDLDVVRQLAEACVDNRHVETAVENAIEAYRQYFRSEALAAPLQSVEGPWHDVAIYVELFATAGRYEEAILELKRLCRWLVGRSSEEFWERLQSDNDCEWDADDHRRALVPQFLQTSSHPGSYGNALPIDLRARLAMYRLRLGHSQEAFRHLSWLDPVEHSTREFIADFPFLAYDVACELMRAGHPAEAARYLEALRELPGDPDSAILVQLGRCYIGSGEQATAEDSFLAAIEADQDNIDARVELANMYEKAREDEEALILAAEALALQDVQGQAGAGVTHVRRVQPASRGPRRRAPRQQTQAGPKKPRAPRSTIPRRYRPRRLAAPGEQQRAEADRAMRLHRLFEEVRELKGKIRNGQLEYVSEWENSSTELIDDFRSIKKFYSWSTYLQFLGTNRQDNMRGEGDNELSQMYARLTRTLAPPSDGHDQDRVTPTVHGGHLGISFDEWLRLFLDYAVYLATDFRRDEAYSVCEAARDSTVFQSSEHNFAIHVAWSACAVYTCDEETSVRVARHLMNENAMSDSSRMFSLLSALCQSPISWYTSGPAQKYILRQIKAIDSGKMVLQTTDAIRGTKQDGTEPSEGESKLDVCLLMLYGHILFTSTSFTFAMTYFLRARSIDPTNPMVMLSLGLAYVHYGLKRQSTNRQYLILQGQLFMARYMESCQKSDSAASRAEMYYNVGRLFHLLGITSLAMRYYKQASTFSSAADGNQDIHTMSVVNQAFASLHIGNDEAALSVIKSHVAL